MLNQVNLLVNLVETVTESLYRYSLKYKLSNSDLRLTKLK